VRRITGTVLALVMGVAALLVSPLSGVAAADHEGPMSRRFAREVVTFGERDRSTYDIEHVRELQWRLRRVGLYRFSPNGTFGTATRAAVTRFQRRHGLRTSGRANRATWSALLRRSNNNLGTARRRCSGDGWHACYDRANHQVTLWRGGRLWNTWLVRGGSRDNATRTGDFTVFKRDKDHVSGLFGSPMPYSQFFSGGQALHGSRNMMDPYEGHSHGCVNMYVEDARQLWNLTHDRRLRVHVYGRWS
jgi:Putative peptidoglycan binding domain/L,D-transpeptidase catalytic domain